MCGVEAHDTWLSLQGIILNIRDHCLSIATTFVKVHLWTVSGIAHKTVIIIKLYFESLYNNFGTLSLFHIA